MAQRRIDRDAWANVIADLIRRLHRGNKSAFARQVGITTRTLDRWLAASVDVSEASVRQIAERIGRNPLDLLVMVGYYRAEELIAAPGEPARPLMPELLVITNYLNDPAVSRAEKAVFEEFLLMMADRARRDRPPEHPEPPDDDSEAG